MFLEFFVFFIAGNGKRKESQHANNKGRFIKNVK